MDEQSRPRRRQRKGFVSPATRSVDYRRLTSPLPLARGYSDDQLADIHAAALTVLQELGVHVNHAGARHLLAQSGALVSRPPGSFSGARWSRPQSPRSPPEFTLTGASGTLRIGGRNTHFIPVGGPPYAMDTARRKRSGTFVGLPQLRCDLAQSFDVIHMTGPSGRTPGHRRRPAPSEDDAGPDAGRRQADIRLCPRRRPGRRTSYEHPATALRPRRSRVPRPASMRTPSSTPTPTPRLILDIPMCQAVDRLRLHLPDVHHHAVHAVRRHDAGDALPGALVQQHAEMLPGSR